MQSDDPAHATLLHEPVRRPMFGITMKSNVKFWLDLKRTGRAVIRIPYHRGSSKPTDPSGPHYQPGRYLIACPEDSVVVEADVTVHGVSYDGELFNELHITNPKGRFVGR